MVKGRQQFIATLESKVAAAILHDIVQMQNNGLGVRTNFNYSLSDILAIQIAGSILKFRNKIQGWYATSLSCIDSKALELVLQPNRIMTISVRIEPSILIYW